MIKFLFISSCCLFFINCAAQKTTPIKAPAVIVRKHHPVKVLNCWQQLDIEKDTMAGTSLQRAYKEILKNKKGKEIIVAVIDTDIDIHHEDLKSSIWVNKDEIPNNGKDDDNNGYIDDVNGWNFLGTVKGESMIYANTEPTRVLKSLKKKYPNFPVFNGNKKDSLLYLIATNEYAQDKDFMIYLRKYAVENLTKYRESEKGLMQKFNKTKFTLSELDSLYFKNKKDSSLTDNIIYMRMFTRLGKDYNSLKNDSIKVEDKLRTTYNEAFYDRLITGDNEFDFKDTHYGNNNVYKNATWTYHGTIVSGVIGANRANKIGIEGFSDQIKIMPILAIPSGGYEHDKDVALAIRYAVDNGAQIINMSFGKTMSLYPELIKEAFLYAEKHNVLLVAGSGNDSSDNDIKPFYPIDYDETTEVEFCNNFIKVGAVALDCDTYFLADFTNYGKKTVDVFAPGFFLKTTDAEAGYSYRDGTSMASPIVAGVAALVWSYYPKLSATQLKQIILESGVAYNIDVQVPGKKEGTLKPFSSLSKSGKVVNAYNALLMAEEYNKK
ncbi:S8 family serine peptidase [Flavobacterium humi]|uniref:Peptidase S8 n=1 Tax=Flavobacterium humi TaxID=2562683 RepID=A0A4Z0L879_9FLAO|nr:S8 family serine peptidase [Flavobacterium humi]TGD58733.1 peptidase S8 [Flavobacterium humi]